LVPLYIEQVEATYRGKDPHYAERKATDLMEYVVRRPDLKVQPAGHRWNNAADITADAWKEAMPQLHPQEGRAPALAFNQPRCPHAAGLPALVL